MLVLLAGRLLAQKVANPQMISELAGVPKVAVLVLLGAQVARNMVRIHVPKEVSSIKKS